MCGATVRVKRFCGISRNDSHGEPSPRFRACVCIGIRAFRCRLWHALGIHLGIVTNGEVRFQEPKIKQLSIGRYLSTVVISEAVQVQKPDPRIFVHALAELGCAALHTWFVGDDPINDVLGAAAVRLRPIWLTGVQPWSPEHPAPRWQIAALGDLLTMVEHPNNAT